MSTSSNHKHTYSRRIESLRTNSGLSRDDSRSSKRRYVSQDDAYTYALRVAYLAYLLQPRQKRKQHTSTPSRQINRVSTSSIQDLMRDFSLIRDSKSTKFPHGYMDVLEKRLTGVMMGKETRQEYQDPSVKRSFAAYLNVFIEPSHKKRMEKDRRVEDLVLIFYSNATKVLQAGRRPDDESWKLMVDRHVALFVRLLSIVMKDSDAWTRDRPELASRLATLESKLLAHDEDLVADGATNGTLTDVITPLSYEVKDMPMVQTVGKIFFKKWDVLQSDINANRTIWTEEAALDDVKKYQKCLSLNSRPLLNSDDFDLEEAYEVWKKAETLTISQMILSILSSNPQLAKSSRPGHGATPSVANIGPPISMGHQHSGSVISISTGSSIRPVRSASYSEAKTPSEEYSSYIVDQPVDMSALSPVTSRTGSLSESDEPSFVFLPTDVRAHYRAILQQTLIAEQNNEENIGDDPSVITLLSRKAIELLDELCLRWRIPYFSRIVMFLDVCRDRFLERAIDAPALIAAFEHAKEPSKDIKKDQHIELFDRSKWTVADIALNQQILRSLNDALLRDLYDIATRCYEPKPPSVGVIVFVLENFIFSDEGFPKNSSDLEEFSKSLSQGLQSRAKDAYQEYLRQHIPADPQEWQFDSIIGLKKDLMNLTNRIQKRYKKNPEIMGANPLVELLSTVLPLFASDVRDLVKQIIHIAKVQEEEIPVDHGFDLYRELVDVRRLHSEALPGVPFAMDVEDLLAGFVWRWIELMEQLVKGWIEGAVKQDNFLIQARPGQDIIDDDRRHSSSVQDMFTSLNEPISKVVGLDWDNDLHYAKFMTSLSRIIGIGIAHYCEIIEQKFIKEMDRLTPEQEAAAVQTKQEKFLQMAKDAWNSKEKIEPFQFFSESFVKLNNIEFAMRQLDNIEKEINVDGCVEVIERHTPPVAVRQRKTTNYVFTIKIVEAEDLKACDMNGLSDPYVVLGDEYQKRLAKTRIIHGNLNPRWDETVDILTQGPLNIVATVWDWDQLGEHDCVGRTSIKLDPSHFSDFLPREYWLDLDTQGRLLLRISMEGERDDIQFYFGKAFRTLKRTEREMTRTITDKLSAYINYCLSRRALKSLLTKPISISTVSNYFNRNKLAAPSTAPTQDEIANALKPLFNYFDDNFAIMNQTLTREAMLMVMTRLWKETLTTIESLVVPPLSDKPSQQKPLSQQELDIVYKWLKLLFDFFNAVDEETKEVNGVPAEVLQSPKYFELMSINFFYFESTDVLVRESERMAANSASRSQTNRNRLSAPAGLTSLHSAQTLLATTGRRTKSIMLSRNLGTMKKAKEEKRREAQMEASDDMILRILRMRPEAQRYLKDRSRQKERLAAAAAAELIVKQSLLAGGGRMAANIPRR